jgi:hypothetical protein
MYNIFYKLNKKEENEMTDLFVVEEINCRGDVRQNKFKIQLVLIQQAIDYALLNQKEQQEIEEEIDDFLDSFENYSITNLLCSIIQIKQFIPDFDPTTFMTKLKENGLVGVESEECVYGIGTTKEFAYQAYCEIQVETSNNDWD